MRFFTLLNIFVMSFLICGCATQEPAEIDYHYNNAAEQAYTTISDNSYKESTDGIKSKPIKSIQRDDTSDSGELKEHEQDRTTVMPNEIQGLKSENNPEHDKFMMPVYGVVISKFGDQSPNGTNNGINIKASEGADIKSIENGTVIYSGKDAKFGNLLIIKLDKRELYVAYAHMRDLLFTKGTKVSLGQVIGHVGKTGNINEPQLHFAIREGKIAVDPTKYIDIIHHN